ncbi:hypothetical protein EUGRSUZ_D02389 [Eucalyptus grandis]|uniref:Uncharacterized protein n=2 Tax=Eucalyptus grandis TaxID=71139 RepID=A0ACC3L8L4_EUCGR|nr:hypothetical protein EUGRSUZ_D02389 [Eucalyptus grandis]
MASPTATAPWEQLLLDALRSNSSLKHSFQLVSLRAPRSLRKKVPIFKAMLPLCFLGVRRLSDPMEDPPIGPSSSGL